MTWISKENGLSPLQTIRLFIPEK